MKILFIISEAPPIISGFARVAEELSAHLRSMGHEVDILSSNEVPRWEIGNVRLSSMVGKGIGAILRRIHTYDMVHVHGATPTFSDAALVYAAIARAAGGPPIVYTHHCEVTLPGKEWLFAPYNMAHHALARLADHVVVSTPSYAESLTHFVAKERTSIIPWGVKAYQRTVTKGDDFHVLFIGQLRSYKGLDVLLRAFQHLSDATLTVIGTGYYAHDYQALATELGLRNVRFLGRVSNAEVRQAYHEAHTIVLPSLNKAEAFGLVLLEGMARGCVPVASHLPGLVDVVGDAGYTVAPGDEAALAATLTSLQHDRITLRRLSETAQRRAVTFSWNRTALAYEALFTGLVQRRPSVASNWFVAPFSPVQESHMRPAFSRSVPLHDGTPPVVQPALHTLFERVAEDFQASRASLMVRHPAQDQLVIAAQKGLDQHLLGAEVSLTHGIAGWVAAQKQPIYIDEVSAPTALRPYLRVPELSSALSVPILDNEQVLGVINLARHMNDKPYTTSDLDQLVTRATTWKDQARSKQTLKLEPLEYLTVHASSKEAQSRGNQTVKLKTESLAVQTTAPSRAPSLQQRRRVSPSMLGVVAGLALVLVLFVVALSVIASGLRPGDLLNLPDLPAWGAWIGYPLVGLITIIGVRLLLYFDNFFFHWPRYRQLQPVTNDDIAALPAIPFVKIQITTRGTPGTTEVIQRGIRNIVALVAEAPELYGTKLSVEVITESREQQQILPQEFKYGLTGQVFVLPKTYATPNGTTLKARALHYLVELRREGLNRKPGQTFIVHYDEESVMEPAELRKLIRYLATTDKRLTEGPIYYPLEYTDASTVCRAMEANRPIGCFECQEVMESGMPLHLHGSNLVIDEALENELGWDIGNLDGQPFIAEDYVFGVLAYLKEGPEIFGWHGAVMLEQPPFSFKSAFKQRYRWVLGVLQGLALMQRMPEFATLPHHARWHMVWGTRYRILTFALGLPTGVLSLLYLLYQAALVVSGRIVQPMPLPIMLWLVLVGFLWLNSIWIGAWYNLASARELSPGQRWTEVARVITVAPIAGILESTAAFWAVANWLRGKREVAWNPTPKTKEADRSMDWEVAQ